MDARPFLLTVLVAPSVLGACICGDDDDCDLDGQDIFVQSMEVTQAIQNEMNTIPLVANRGTAVRVRVGINGTGTVDEVTGRLHVHVGTTQITPNDGVEPINAGFEPPNTSVWDKNIEEHTLNFELVAPTGIPVTDQARFDVELCNDGDPDASNNVGSVNPVVVVPPVNPRLYYTYVVVAGHEPPSEDTKKLVEPGVGDLLVRGVYPVDDSTLAYMEELTSPLIWSGDDNGNDQVDTDEKDDLLDLLESQRQLIVTQQGNGDDIFLYGWLEVIVENNGWTPNDGGRVGFGNTDPVRHQKTYAHELGHNFGFYHSDRRLTPPVVGWDTTSRLAGAPFENQTVGRAKVSAPVSVAQWDLMTGGVVTQQTWIDDLTYGSLLAASASNGLLSASDYQLGIVFVSGILNSDGLSLSRLNPVFRYPWPAQPSVVVADGEFEVRVVTDRESYNARFAGTTGHDGAEPTEYYGFFAVRLAIPEAETLRSVQIFRGGDALGDPLMVSAVPTLTVTEPTNGAELPIPGSGPQVTVRFNVVDDTPLEEIRVNVAYSSDAGRTWVPVAVNVPASAGAVTFDSRGIVSSDAGGVLRVIASDGLNTVFEDVIEIRMTGGR